MSTEFTPGSNIPEFETPPVFPISQATVDSTVSWEKSMVLSSEGNLAMEESLLRRNYPRLGNFSHDMELLRGQVQLTEEQLLRYRQGAVFAFRLMESQFDTAGLSLPSVEPSTLTYYFRTLLTTPTIPHLFENLSNAQPGMQKTALTPKGLREMCIARPSDPLLKKVGAVFEAQSAGTLSKMWGVENDLFLAMFDLHENINDGRRGFYLGLVDLHQPVMLEHTLGPWAAILDNKEF